MPIPNSLRGYREFDLSDDAADAGNFADVYLLDVGPEDYGDSVLCRFKSHTILIDGAHPGNWQEKEGHPAIQDQLAEILKQQPDAIHVDLLMISHAHDDHIGCLPRLVANGWLTADWALVPDPDLGWGRSADADARLDEQLDARSRQLVNALREEPRSPGLTDAQIQTFLLDADLEQPYRDMLVTLKKNGTKVRRFGRDSHADLVKAFADVGLEILGPRKPHLAVCAENVLQGRNDAIDFVKQRMPPDVRGSASAVYRAMMQASLDGVDVKRYGNYVNLQSHVACFEVGEKKFFFAGDMQFAQPGTRDEVINAEVDRLKGEIAARAPYAFFKLCHHGSWNGLDGDMLDGLGTTRYLGICTGQRSDKHPDANVLKLLKDNSAKLTWARTDHNGQCRFHYTASAAAATVTPERGKLNDAVPNKKLDEPAGELVSGTPPAATATPAEISAPPQPAETRIERLDDDRTVEVTARIPHKRTRVTIVVDVDPEPESSNDPRTLSPPPRGTTAEMPRTVTAPAGVERLLVATNKDALGRNIGTAAAQGVINALRARGATVVDDVPTDAEASIAAQRVQAEIRSKKYKGVVLLGGYDVVPSQVLDSLPPSLRRRVGTTGDPDNFVVWNDEVYGDFDGDLLPELPVSRIPDGHSADVVLGALRAGGAGAISTAGIRNVARPFADTVYRQISGNGQMLASEPTEYNIPGLKLAGDRIYIMLHGDYSDGSRFWGEETPHDLEAMNISNVPDQTTAVVFTGCCWGALTVDRPAGRLNRGQALVPKRPESSIALTFLKRGARAFIGCTGAHYSPEEPPYRYFGGPMHAAFWEQILAGAPPALALFEAKKRYMSEMPHGQTTPSSTAIECKIWRQYTCLGLGW